MRKLVVVLAAVAAALFGVLPARAGDDLTAMTNSDRQANRLGALSPTGDLISFAQRRAEDMAREQRIYHTPDLGNKVANWKRLGENVGRGKSLDDIEASFMASPSHRENILSRDFTQIGVGMARNGELVYVAVLFRLPANAAPATTTTSPPRPPAPKPVVEAPRRAEVKAPPAPVLPPPAPATTTTLPPPPPPPPVVESPPVIAALPVVEAPAPPPVVDAYGLEAAGDLPWRYLSSDILGATQSASALTPIVATEPDLVRPIAVGTAMVGIGYVSTMLVEELRRRRRLVTG